MQPVNYDIIAPAFDRRYERNAYDGVRAVLHRFSGALPDAVVLEVGCGSGHWLADLSSHGVRRLLGVDRSARMLELAKVAAPNACLVRAEATSLPWSNRSVDRVFCVNALHHFPEQQPFLAECRRVLRPGGGVLTVGLDPHGGQDRWWVYDYFPAALSADRQRYRSTHTIREWLSAVGFESPVTEVAETFSAEIPFALAWQQGMVDRRATSQFMVISDREYERGVARLMAEQPVLRSEVRLYATSAWL
jgi:ubiquinone/menaquinone biosynthesis C-methylase UbiE